MAKSKATWRMGQQQRERLQWTVVAIICLLLFMGIRPYYLHVIEVREFQTCQSNILQIAGAINRYASDWDDALPIGGRWMDNIQGNLAVRTNTGFQISDLFHCPLDHTGAQNSYAYNNLFDGISLNVASSSEEMRARRKLLGNTTRSPLVIEKHGGKVNEVISLQNWDEIAKAITTPHMLPEATGSMISGSIKPSSLSEEKLKSHKGEKF